MDAAKAIGARTGAEQFRLWKDSQNGVDVTWEARAARAHAAKAAEAVGGGKIDMKVVNRIRKVAAPERDSPATQGNSEFQAYQTARETQRSVVRKQRDDANVITQAWSENRGRVSHLMRETRQGTDTYARNVIAAFQLHGPAGAEPNPKAVEYYATGLGAVLDKGNHQDVNEAYELAGQIASRHSGMDVRVYRQMHGYGAVTAKATPRA